MWHTKSDRMRLIITIFICLGLTSSCYMTSKPYSEINVYKYSNGYKYEVQIKYQTKGRGNIHNFNLKKYEYKGYDWFYVNTINGRLYPDSLLFTQFQRKTDSPWAVKNLKGYIEFVNDSLNIDLYFYNQENPNEKELPYEFNGKYRVKINNYIAPLIDDF